MWWHKSKTTGKWAAADILMVGPFMKFIFDTSGVANYIIARSMKEGKGRQCQEGQGAYQEPKRSSWLA